MTYHPRQSHRLLATLFLTQSLFSAGLIAATTLMSIIAADLSGREAYAGLPQSISPLMQALVAYPFGWLMGRVGRRIGISLGYTLGMIGAFLGVLALESGSFALLLMGAGCLGMARAGGDMSRFAAAELYPDTQRARAIGLIVWAGTVGAILGPSVVAPMGKLAEGWHLSSDTGAWLFSLVVFGTGALLTFLFLRPDPRWISQKLTSVYEPTQISQAPAASLAEIFARPSVQLALAAMLIGQAVMVAIMVMTPLEMKHHAHGKEAISVVIMAHTLGMFGISPLTGWLLDRFGRVNMILAGAAILILAAVTAPLSAQMLPLVLALFLLGVGWNFCFIGGTSLLSDSLSMAERGRAQGLNDMLVALAASLGSFGSGILFDVGGYVAVAAMGLLLTLVLTGLIGNLSPRLSPLIVQ